MIFIVQKPRYTWKTETFKMSNWDRPVAFDYRVIDWAKASKDGTLTLPADERVVAVLP